MTDKQSVILETKQAIQCPATVNRKKYGHHRNPQPFQFKTNFTLKRNVQCGKIITSDAML